MPNWSVILSCEHGGNRVPAAWRGVLQDAVLLNSHRGWDAGALNMARHMARQLGAPLHAAQITRLLVDLNRSTTHPRLHSEAVRQLDAAQRQRIVARHYRPFREAFEEDVHAHIEQGHQVLHISVHSFTPELNGEQRNADIGLLYDPSRQAERALCLRWQALLKATDPQWRVRRNYPYAGIEDGHATALRKHFDARHYAGIELEVNQRFALEGGHLWKQIKRDLTRSLQSLLEETAS